MKQHVINTDLR